MKAWIAIGAVVAVIAAAFWYYNRPVPVELEPPVVVAPAAPQTLAPAPVTNPAPPPAPPPAAAPAPAVSSAPATAPAVVPVAPVPDVTAAPTEITSETFLDVLDRSDLSDEVKVRLRSAYELAKDNPAVLQDVVGQLKTALGR